MKTLSKTSEPQRETQLSIAINRLEKLTEEHGEIQIKITHQLQDVLTPDPPTPCKEETGCDRNPEPPAVARLRNITERLEVIAGRYMELCQRIEA